MEIEILNQIQSRKVMAQGRIISRTEVDAALKCDRYRYYHSPKLNPQREPSVWTKRIIEQYAPCAVGNQTMEKLTAQAREELDACRYELDPDEDHYSVHLGQGDLVEAAIYAVRLRSREWTSELVFAAPLPLGEIGVAYVPEAPLLLLRAWFPGEEYSLCFIRPYSVFDREALEDIGNALDIQADIAAAAIGFPDLRGAWILPLVIGRRDGEHQASPLTRYWTGPGDLRAWKYEWTDATGSHRLGKNWQKQYASHQVGQVTPGELVVILYTGIQPEAGSAFHHIFPAPVWVERSEPLFQEWLAQTTYSESRIQQQNVVGGAYRNYRACHRHGKCEHYDRCWSNRPEVPK